MDGRGVAETEKENVLIQSGHCSVSVFPHLGGKIASIRFKGRELLQTPLAPPEPRNRTMSFDASDASGWDECLPTVAACTVSNSSGTAHIPDHGDLWRVSWEVMHGSDSSMTLRGACFSLPLVLERKLVLEETERGAHLQLQYKLTNAGSHSVPWAWAVHPLFAVEPGDQIELPASIAQVRVEGSSGGRLGKAGDKVAWPIAKLAEGSTTNLSVAQDPALHIGDKVFAGPLTGSENWCALRRARAGVRIRVGFDPEATPYLGLWICYGGWPDGPGRKQNCVALEPTTAPVDSLAQTGSWSRMLAPGQSHEWPMSVDFEFLQV